MGGGLVVELLPGVQDGVTRRSLQLQRRHDDLVAGRPVSETEADGKLAGGYLLPDEGARPRPREQ